MRTLTLLLCISFVFVLPLSSQNLIPSYHGYYDFLHASSGALGVGLYGFDNPALLTYLRQPDLYFTWSDQGPRWNSLDRWGLFTAVPHLGFGMIRQRASGSGGHHVAVMDYRLALSAGSRTASVGLGYGWSSGDRDAFGRKSLLSLGALVRPLRYLSVGAVGTTTFSGGHSQAIVDVGVRPLGNELLTLFSDYEFRRKQMLRDGHWSAGAALEPLPGLRFTGRYFDTKSFSVGVQISFGRFGLTSQTHFDKNAKRAYGTHGIRFGAYDRNLFRTHLMRGQNYLEVDLFGPVRYQRYLLFDKSNVLLKLLNDIDAAKEDPSISGIAINTSGMEINRAMVWELREKLKEFRAAGKHVVMYVDFLDITGYHLASVADRIVMDQQGILVLEGYLFGRLYLKGTLEKLGIGFDEWRFFAYKSAAETFSRDSMSEADREQRQALVNDAYKLARTDIAESRGLRPEEFDALVNDDFIFLPQDALEKGLVDTLGRWDEVKTVIEQLEGKKKRFVKSKSLARYQLPFDNAWGERPRIAVIYALGVCAMDEGITARKLVKDVEAATKDRRVKAVVLRVDSPGGDALASDIIAEALRKCREKKPVIISQGYVAASGGYWLSMYGDTIVAAPNTITGSIGVIGGWFYDRGIKEKLGTSTDHVKVGRHADLGFGITIPLLGVRIPDRNLTDTEWAKMERLIRQLYEEFVTKVSSGRGLAYEEVESIAQGRVWSGYDAKANGLIDELGGLHEAIRIARERAGIPSEKEVAIVEYPRPALLDPKVFSPRLFGIDVQREPWVEHLKFRIERNGQPLPILPLEVMEIE